MPKNSKIETFRYKIPRFAKLLNFQRQCIKYCENYGVEDKKTETIIFYHKF